MNRLLLSILVFLILLPLTVTAAFAGRFCSSGHENPDRAMFCMICAENLAEATTQPPKKLTTPTPKTQFDSEYREEPVVTPEYENLYSQSYEPEPQPTSIDGFKELLSEDPDFILPENVPQDGVLTRWFGSDPKGFNYITEAGVDVQEHIYAYVTDSLARRHVENPDNWAPMLAESILVNQDYTEYRIKLRRDVKWHFPLVDLRSPKYKWLAVEHQVTAADIAYYLDIVRDPTVNTAGLGSYYEDIISYKIIDPYSITIRWGQSLHHSLGSIMSIVPLPEFIYAYNEKGKRYSKEEQGKAFNEHWYNHRAIGCGPYQFIGYEPGVSITLERFEDYWGEAPPIKQLKYLIYRDPHQNILKIKSMEQDFSVLTPGQYRDEILNGRAVSPVTGEPLKVGVYQGMVYYYIGWNLARPPFNDKTVRVAMTYAFNRQDLLENIFYNLGEVTCSSVYKNSPEYNETLIPRAFSLKKAAEILDAADWIDRDGDGIREKYIGLNKVELKFTLLIYADSIEWRAVSSMYKEDLRKLGIIMKIKAVDWTVMQNCMDNREFDAFIGGWGLNWETDPYQVWHSTQADALGGSNVISFRNAEADEIMQKLRATFDKKERKTLIDRFQQILYDEQPYTFFMTRKYVAIWWDYLKNVKFRKLSPHELALPWYVVPH